LISLRLPGAFKAIDDAEKTMQNSTQTITEEGRTKSHTSNTGYDVNPSGRNTNQEKKPAFQCETQAIVNQWAGLAQNFLTQRLKKKTLTKIAQITCGLNRGLIVMKRLKSGLICNNSLTSGRLCQKK